METDPDHPQVVGSIPVSSTFFAKTVTFNFLLVFFRFKINGRNKQEGGGWLLGRGASIDLDCVETMCFKNLDFCR